ncbi:glutamyl-tRNA reductase [Endozoicomonas ascidiicola]|uniref:glutamyl-tRNA reductase n=1 Tax=Endozoicomonas ascidiicola TaxID=1698521 RepID=UPI0008321E74|nr:glutamyl-tRNA reductase [Endozoicomonas ascidiicola]
MGYFTAGINHRTAPITLREQVAFSTDKLADALQDARQYTGIDEIAILSTCNRTEIYCATLHHDEDHIQDCYQQIIHWLTRYHSIDSHQTDSQHLIEHSYFFHDREAVKHLMRVACGLDSMILGEPQILGQLKTAYASAQEAGTAGSGLNRLFQHGFTTAKQIRTETAINQQPVSVAYAATRLAKQIFADLSQNTALLVGAGETIELTARHLCQQGVSNIIVANRTIERAKRLTDMFGGKPVLLSDLPQVLHESDIVISSTASPVPVLGKGAIERALKQRKHRPMFMVDIAVPRDIEPEVSELSDVFLYTVDDLQDVIEDNLQQRKDAAQQAERMIEADAFEFMTRLRALDAVHLLKQYRQNTEHLRDQELEKAMQWLAKGANPEEVLQQFARAMTNKMMHHPSVQLKLAAASGQHEKLQWAEKLLGLETDPTTSTQDA